MPTTPSFGTFLKNPFNGILLTLDPGETTGWSIWAKNVMFQCGQLPTLTVKQSINILGPYIRDSDALVIEEYRVYQHKTESHAQDTLHTARLIGAIECLCVLHNKPYRMQGAGIAKGWATDEKLKDWELYKRGERHARDAIRHACYFLHHGKPFA